MAQLNPNFEIDFNDINSYEQIQLINDTQLAKENLLMHKAYKEPAEDEIIRNQFSSFTFVDFCPKLFNAATTTSPTPTGLLNASAARHQYQLETFSDLFNRINLWLRFNKDWRVVSMETLIFDCASQFNHLKSSIHSSQLPRNMRGLRLYLSPSKSRFSEPQKIGCINVVPRKTSGQYSDPTSRIEYETLDQILARLNELLLTRPIEGRILSVETITLPIANGYVNTETNYFMDARLNGLNQRLFSHAEQAAYQQCWAAREGDSTPAADGPGHRCPRAFQTSGLIDILRVYYEFGSMVCGLVNLIDFLPRFHLRPRLTSSLLTGSTPASPTPGQCADHNSEDSNEDEKEKEEEAQREASESGAKSNQERAQEAEREEAAEEVEVNSTESLTRLIQRSLAWFEAERKRILNETRQDAENGDATPGQADRSHNNSNNNNNKEKMQQVDVKVCNLQTHTRVLPRSKLARLSASSVLEVVKTRHMFHESPRDPIVCHQCGGLSSFSHEPHEWCPHLLDMDQPCELKFVRLAYVVPVHNNKYGAASRLASSGPLSAVRLMPVSTYSPEAPAPSKLRPSSRGESKAEDNSLSSSSSSSSSSDEDEDEDEDEDDEAAAILSGDLQETQESTELAMKQASLMVVHSTNKRHLANERAHQLADDDQESSSAAAAAGSDGGQLIGQLTYRLFAPCQLVSSSSCFSINPVNSSNPLARRGSMVSNGAGRSSTVSSFSTDYATPSTLLLPAGSGSSATGADSLSGSTLTINQQQANQVSQQTISFGAFFPALSHEITLGSNSTSSSSSNQRNSSQRLNSNDFEPVEAIRRRMEVYVTTNSMKVLAGETLVVNLNDHLSCLSNAIERTLVRAPFSKTRQPSTWVSVYVLYAAVDEPQLPSQLLEQQKQRERLELIREADDSASGQAQQAMGSDTASSQSEQSQSAKNQSSQENMVPVFDDDFKSAPPAQEAGAVARTTLKRKQRGAGAADSLAIPAKLAQNLAATNLEDGGIRVELSRGLSAGADGGGSQEGAGKQAIGHQDGQLSRAATPIYNSAYDRTVALPTQPDENLANYLEPVDLNLEDSWAHHLGLQKQSAPNDSQASHPPAWPDHSDLVEPQSYHLSDSNIRDASKLMRMRQQLAAANSDSSRSGSPALATTSFNSAMSARALAKERKRARKREQRARRRAQDSQCSVM